MRACPCPASTPPWVLGALLTYLYGAQGRLHLCGAPPGCDHPRSLAVRRGVRAWGRARREPRGAERNGLLAVVIPVFARTPLHVRQLRAALQHVLAQRGRPATHVVLVDDASPLALDVALAPGGTQARAPPAPRPPPPLAALAEIQEKARWGLTTDGVATADGAAAPGRKALGA